VKELKQVLSGNEAIALGAYHAGVGVAAAYPGTPSTEILEAIARFPGLYVEWSTNEKVAIEVALGSALAGVRAMTSMKHVGLNVAADPFLTASMVGVKSGLVVISADDPGMHSSQNEQDNRHYAPFARVPMLEPSDSQEAYSLMADAYSLSEELDSPILFRSTTRISHAKGVVQVDGERPEQTPPPIFGHLPQKYVMVPSYARPRHPLMEQRITRTAQLFEKFPRNEAIWGDKEIGVISAGVAYQYAREALPEASFLKLVTTYPLPQELVRAFAAEVETLLVVEELDPFLEDQIRLMGIPVQGKALFPVTGELSTQLVLEGAKKAGLIQHEAKKVIAAPDLPGDLPARPPLLCPGCPHRGMAYVLNELGFGPGELTGKSEARRHIVTSDIGCYTLMVYPPLASIDTCVCMGGSIGMAHGLEKAGVAERVVAILGDSTFMHAGIPALVNMFYNRSRSTVIVLDNRTTAMTGHQGHPASGRSARDEEAPMVDIASLARGIGIKDVNVISAFDLKELEATLRRCTENEETSVVVATGDCPLFQRVGATPFRVDAERCSGCELCLNLGCPSITFAEEQASILVSCVGESCGLCLQLCPSEAIEKVGD
jgi:indolepyruvate ferredoxin oxidoreductase alpha subunit